MDVARKFSARPAKILAHDDLNPKATQAPAPCIHPAAPVSPCLPDARIHRNPDTGLPTPGSTPPPLPTPHPPRRPRPTPASTPSPRPTPALLHRARHPGQRLFGCVQHAAPADARLHPVAPADARPAPPHRPARRPGRRLFGCVQHAAPIGQTRLLKALACAYLCKPRRRPLQRLITMNQNA
ncbi:hypothetical protein BDA96_09G116200 [Sorghum bicolor]|uniref:Uncharacterized protein n=1 Tax=Sorghum bicolor TaxID=4558 RepID=A0A921U4L2_SORBI|nr:hypothetical protein BDA96_09G116200 [Sorghum bicolor]